MNRYVAKTPSVYAMRWDGTASGAIPIIQWVLSQDGSATYKCEGPGYCTGSNNQHVISVRMADGSESQAEGVGWYVVQAGGSHYALSPEIFEGEYERARDE